MPRRLAPPAEPLSDGVIRLEPLDERYAEDFDSLVEDPQVVRNTRIPSDVPPGYGEEWVGRYVDGWRNGDRGGYAILDEEGEFLGFVAVVDFDPEGNQGEIGYVTTREARGKRVAQRALRLITNWALDGAGLERVELHIDPQNPASVRVAERCGYVREGLLRSLHFKGDERADTVIYSLLPSDPR